MPRPLNWLMGEGTYKNQRPLGGLGQDDMTTAGDLAAFNASGAASLLNPVGVGPTGGGAAALYQTVVSNPANAITQDYLPLALVGIAAVFFLMESTDYEKKRGK